MLLLLLLLLFFPIVIIFVFLFLVHADKFQTILAISRLGPCTMAPCPPPFNVCSYGSPCTVFGAPINIKRGDSGENVFSNVVSGWPKAFWPGYYSLGLLTWVVLNDLKKIVLLTKSCRDICSRLMLEPLELYMGEEVFIHVFEGSIT